MFFPCRLAPNYLTVSDPLPLSPSRVHLQLLVIASCL